MMPLVILVLTSAALFTGCATAYQPPSDVVWAYTATSGTASNLRVLGYAPTKDACELMRARDSYGYTKNLAWTQMALSDCAQAIVSSGHDYWIFSFYSLTRTAAGISPQVLCDVARRQSTNPFSTVDCAPVALRFLTQP